MEIDSQNVRDKKTVNNRLALVCLRIYGKVFFVRHFFASLLNAIILQHKADLGEEKNPIRSCKKKLTVTAKIPFNVYTTYEVRTYVHGDVLTFFVSFTKLFRNFNFQCPFQDCQVSLAFSKQD